MENVYEKNKTKKIFLSYLSIRSLRKTCRKHKVSESRASNSFKYYWPYLHKNRFNPRILKILLTKRESGFFVKNISGINRVFDKKFRLLVDSLALSDNGNGYIYFTYNKKNYYYHRFIMGVKHGDKILIDHIDRNKNNNLLSNLRLATSTMNLSNRSDTKLYRDVREEYPSSKKPFVIRVKEFYGRFETEEEAIEKVQEIKRKRIEQRVDI